MPADLRDRLHAAVGDPVPPSTRVDLDEAWTRGRRRRHARQALAATSAVSLLAVGALALGQLPLGSDPDVAGRPSVDEAPALDLDAAEGWVRLEAGRHALDEVRPAIDDPAAIEDVVILEDAAEWPWRPVWDVAADGTVRWLDADGHRIGERAPDGSVTFGEVVEGFHHQGGRAFVTALQIGPDGRTYATGPSFEAADVRNGQTQVMVLDAEGRTQSLRANDPSLVSGMLFAGDHGWQLHDPDTNRWQPIVRIGEAQVLPAGEQRRLEHRGDLDPDGIRLEIGGLQGPEHESRFTLHTRRGELRWQFDLPDGLNGWATAASNRAAGQRLLVLDGTGTGTSDSYVLRLDPAGFVDAVRVDTTVAPGLEGVPDATAVLGADGYLYWPERRPGGDIAIVRYVHPFAKDAPGAG